MTLTKLEHGPYGTRWSFIGNEPPTVAEVQEIVGVKLAERTCDASGEREDGECETIYFAEEEFNDNTLATFRVQ